LAESETDERAGAAGIAEAVAEISERASLLIREEIELAKAEVGVKLGRLLRGAGIGAAAAIFAIFGLVVLVEGLAWLAWYLLPVDGSKIFWGFFLVAGALFVLGALAGWIAARLLKAGSPPTPQMAIDEARRTKEELR
jgi:hypothetical protein